MGEPSGTAPESATEKQALEIRKLRQETSWLAQILSLMLPITLAVLSFVQFIQLRHDTEVSNVRADHETALKNLETHIKLVELVGKQTEDLKAAGGWDTPDAIEAINYLAYLLPPDEACTALNAMVKAHTAAGIGNATAMQRRDEIGARAGSSAASCSAQVRAAQDDTIIALAQRTPVAEQNTPTAASGCKPPAKSTAPLAVYYQVVRPDDREKSSVVGQKVSETTLSNTSISAFPYAGTEYVRGRETKQSGAEVRFYYDRQKDDASWLACLLKETTNRPFSLIPLEGKFAKLPDKRIEVWFPPLSDSK